MAHSERVVPLLRGIWHLKQSQLLARLTAFLIAGVQQAGAAYVVGSTCEKFSNARLIDRATLSPEQTLRWPFGGISGLDYHPGQNRFYAISDNRATIGDARYYTFSLADNFVLEDLEEISLLGVDGGPYLPETVDPESIRYHPAGWFVWSSELPEHRPNVYVTSTDDGATSILELPDHIYPGKHEHRGARSNKFVEGLSFSPDYKYLIMALEGPLIQDGMPPDTDRGATTRILVFETETLQAVAEHLYRLDPIPLPAEDGSKLHDNGVSEILALDRETLLVLERSGRHLANHEFAYDVRLYCVDLRGASSIPKADASANYRPERADDVAKKRQVRITDRGVVVRLQDNFEAMTLGPEKKTGRSLYLLSDNNFKESTETLLLVLQIPAE